MRLRSPLLLALLLCLAPRWAAAEDGPPPLGTGHLFLGGHLGAALRFGNQGLIPEFGVMPYSERLRFTFTPFALQNHSGGERARAVVVQLALEYALR